MIVITFLARVHIGSPPLLSPINTSAANETSSHGPFHAKWPQEGRIGALIAETVVGVYSKNAGP